MTPTPSPLLGPNQRRLVGYTIAFFCLILVVGLIAFSITVLGSLLVIFSSLLWPLAVAGVLALMLRPLVAGLQKHLRLSPLGAVILLYGFIAVVGTALLALLIPLIFAQIQDLIVLVPQLVNQAVEYLQNNVPRWTEVFQERTGQSAEIQKHVELWLSGLGDWLMSSTPKLLAAGGALLAVVGVAAGLSVVPVYLFFFLQSQRDPTESLHGALPFLKEEKRQDIVFLAREFVSLIVAFFRGQLVIAMIMGVLFAIGFSAVGLRFSIIIGLTLGLLSIVPYLGAIIGLLITIPLALLQPEGSLGLAGMVIGVFVAVQAVESTLLTPKIMGDTTGLHPVVIILSIFFWGIALGGLLGMILAIPLTAFFVTAWRLAKVKYIREIG